MPNRVRTNVTPLMSGEGFSSRPLAGPTGGTSAGFLHPDYERLPGAKVAVAPRSNARGLTLRDLQLCGELPRYESGPCELGAAPLGGSQQEIAEWVARRLVKDSGRAHGDLIAGVVRRWRFVLEHIPAPSRDPAAVEAQIQRLASLRRVALVPTPRVLPDPFSGAVDSNATLESFTLGTTVAFSDLYSLQVGPHAYRMGMVSYALDKQLMKRSRAILFIDRGVARVIAELDPDLPRCLRNVMQLTTHDLTSHAYADSAFVRNVGKGSIGRWGRDLGVDDIDAGEGMEIFAAQLHRVAWDGLSRSRPRVREAMIKNALRYVDRVDALCARASDADGSLRRYLLTAYFKVHFFNVFHPNSDARLRELILREPYLAELSAATRAIHRNGSLTLGGQRVSAEEALAKYLEAFRDDFGA